MANKLYAHIIIDESGSMAWCKDKTIDAVNQYVEGLKANGQTNTTISLTTFSGSDVKHVRKAVNISSFKQISNEDYNPGGGTNLFDAVGETVRFIETEVKVEDDENVSVIIMTDGEENTSKEFTKENIQKLLKTKTDEEWLITYLGANQDGWAAGQQTLGLSGSRSATFDLNSIGSSMQTLAASTSTYNSMGGRGGDSLLRASKSAYGFTEQDRESFVGEEKKSTK